MNSEILNLAYTLELQGLEMYTNFSNKEDIFSQILAIKKNGVELLRAYANDNKIELMEHLLDIVKPDALDDCLIKAINYELELNNFYQNATDNVDDDKLRDILFRLWATSNNEYIMALKAKLIEILLPSSVMQNSKQTEQKIQNESNFDINSLNQISATIEKFASGQANNEDFMALLKSPNLSFFGGLAIGGLAAMMISKENNKNQENKE